MNTIHSQPEFHYRERWLTPSLQAAAADHRVVVLTGARQVGKSTLLLNAEPTCNWRYYTFDDFDALRQAEREPGALWAGAAEIVLDEVQKAPQILSAVKQAVDRRRPAVRFVLSGSANLLLMRQVSETLAGRAVYFTLLPMTVGESEGTAAPSLLVDLLEGRFPPERKIQPKIAAPLSLLLRGFMPPLLALSQPAAWERWWEGYIATYLERDLRQMSQIDALTDFRRLMEFAALRTGQMVNQTEMARDAKLSQPTVHRYLNLLEATHLMQRVPAFVTSHSTRLIKSPKLHWADPALAIFLSGYHDVESLSRARELGAYFETLIYQHLLALSQLQTPRPRIFYWRTPRGVEVDFVVEQGRRVLAVEVKMSTQARFADADGLNAFLSEYRQAQGGLLIYMGTEVKRLSEKILAVPWECLIH
ncbi:MAG: ATP-binding protein [Acidobacteria bacterium]|nr:ATP-binding protein [Acidobacteriota bacterium]MBI3655812.1 ATP-binding protein [Acidobacteriota bacterium]